MRVLRDGAASYAAPATASSPASLLLLLCPHPWALRQAVLNAFLQTHLPEDAHERCNDRAYVAVTRVVPLARPVLVHRFTSRDDLIQALMTSCHIPFWLDGNAFTGGRRALRARARARLGRSGRPAGRGRGAGAAALHASTRTCLRAHPPPLPPTPPTRPLQCFGASGTATAG